MTDTHGPESLWDRLCRVPNRRGRKGRQYALPSVLMLALAAALSGADDLLAMCRWGRRLPAEALFLFDPERAPCHATYHYFFRALDVAAVEQVLGAWVLEEGSTGHVTLDGKRLCGDQHAPERAGPNELLRLWRDHWLIENRLHWRRDMVLCEHRSRVRSGSAPQVMVALRNTVMVMARNRSEPLRATRAALAGNRLKTIKAAINGVL